MVKTQINSELADFGEVVFGVSKKYSEKSRGLSILRSATRADILTTQPTKRFVLILPAMLRQYR